MDIIQVLAVSLVLVLTHLACVEFGVQIVRGEPQYKAESSEKPQDKEEVDRRQLKQYYNLLNYNGTKGGQLELDE
ncbi:MAG: hypothetical protein IKV41_05700 [Oscillospiraceae bacterium]|nr:hypothetical protein [Oscillospiraceae bacterium]